MLFERRYCELRSEGRTLTGTAVAYGDVARLPFGRERIVAGAFGDLSQADAILNVQHRRDRPLARTGGGGLALSDSDKALTIRAELPATRDGDDALLLVRRRILRGLSIEFAALRESVDDRVRVIERARLIGVGLVDRPAYRGSGDIAVRRAGRGLAASFRYGETKTVSDRGRRRKVRVRAGAFARSIADRGQEIILQSGGDPGKILAAKGNGSLQLSDSERALGVIAEELPDTTYTRDLRAQLDAGFEVGIEPLYRIPPADAVANATELVPETGNPGVLVEQVNEATLFAISVRARPSFPRPDVQRRERAAPRRVWL